MPGVYADFCFCVFKVQMQLTCTRRPSLEFREFLKGPRANFPALIPQSLWQITSIWVKGMLVWIDSKLTAVDITQSTLPSLVHFCFRHDRSMRYT
jgi:hypothetical protein